MPQKYGLSLFLYKVNISQLTRRRPVNHRTVAPCHYFYPPHTRFAKALKNVSVTTNNMSEWTPPASGTPCWLNIPARDVGRGK